MIDVVSIAGAFLTLLAFFMVTSQRWTPTGVAYNAVNLAACVVLGGVALYTGTAGYILLNGVWGVVAVWNLVTKKARSEGDN